MKKWLDDLKKLPEEKKKYVVWFIVSIIGLILIIWWVSSITMRFKQIDWSATKNNLNPPKQSEEWTNISDLVPDITIEELFSIDKENSSDEALEGDIQQESNE